MLEKNDSKLLNELDELIQKSETIHLPLPIDEAETAEKRLLAKPVHKSRMIDDMMSLAFWQAVTAYASIELSDEHYLKGSHSLKFTSPTNLPEWLPDRARGRIYAEPAAKRVIEREDWRSWNRLSVWVYPVAPGMKSINLRMQLHNDGEHKVPDRHEREGAHNFNLKPEQWNHIVLELPYLHRDCITGVSFVYDMCGHEPDAADQCMWYIDQLELQKVDCDVYEGWTPGDGRLAYSGSGYKPGQEKLAIASNLKTASFFVIDLENGRRILKKDLQTTEGPSGPLQLMDFSEVNEPGRYLLAAGEVFSRPFYIDEAVWLPSVWKVLNFYLSQRCGYEVPGKHRLCHTDMLLKKDDKAIVANGGWHDAADLAQGMNNTSDGTSALLMLADKLRNTDKRLYKRVLEEAKWGLDYVLKMRFGDGFRSVYSSSSIWTDGVIGTADDIISEPDNQPLINLMAAYAEALGARVFAEVDADYARYCQKIAYEDYQFGIEKWQPEQVAATVEVSHQYGPPILLASLVSLVAGELFRLTKESSLADMMSRTASLICDCQQTDYPEWEKPLRGFFYQEPAKEIVWHHNHHSFAHYPLLALATASELLPGHQEQPRWLEAIRLNGTYHLEIASYTAPYYMIPEGVYHEDEAFDHFDKALSNHPFLGDRPENVAQLYRQQVQQGEPLGSGWYLRRFPVWFSFRGNISVQLSQAVCTNIAACETGNKTLYGLSQRQLEWVVGKNPFAQSLLYGEGYDYVQQYAVQPGQTIGQLPVGMQSKFETDQPFWPQVNTATYKEVWISSANKWIWNMVYAL